MATAKKIVSVNTKDRSCKVGRRRYRSIREMLIGEKIPEQVIKRVDELLAKNLQITDEFLNGASVANLAQDHLMLIPEIEASIRYGLCIARNKRGRK